jgi:hypothetical protein
VRPDAIAREEVLAPGFDDPAGWLNIAAVDHANMSMPAIASPVPRNFHAGGSSGTSSVVKASADS